MYKYLFLSLGQNFVVNALIFSKFIPLLLVLLIENKFRGSEFILETTISALALLEGKLSALLLFMLDFFSTIV